MSDTRINENGDPIKVLDHEVILTRFRDGKLGIETDSGYIELAPEQLALIVEAAR